ncbi:MAG: hypothetical protein HW389_1674 [Bacteroidetes bacterium]|nr:hypothetical protein [Bacteroidota bacterium]
MNLFSFFRSERLDTDWKYIANGLIWRLLFTESGRVVGECRNQDKKTVSFFCLDEESGNPLWQDLNLEESWWVGIEAVLNDTVLFHSYASPDMPEHRGIRAYDTRTGILRWRNDDATFWFGFGDRVFAYRDLFEKRVGYEIGLQTGELKATFDESLQELHALRREAIDSQPASEVTPPEILTDNALDPSMLALVNRTARGKKIAGSVEYVKQNDVLAFNYHILARTPAVQSQSFENHLFVYRLPQCRCVFSDIIGRDLKAHVPDSFFVRRSRLFFVKDQHTLTALRLWKGEKP